MSHNTAGKDWVCCYKDSKVRVSINSAGEVFILNSNDQNVRVVVSAVGSSLHVLSSHPVQVSDESGKKFIVSPVPSVSREVKCLGCGHVMTTSLGMYRCPNCDRCPDCENSESSSRSSFSSV